VGASGRECHSVQGHAEIHQAADLASASVARELYLGDLHDAIQVAMGWHNCHMHAFRFGDVQYSSRESSEMEDMDTKDEETALLSRVVTRPRQKFIYEYDFGDSWEHEIVVEKMLPIDPQGKYPVCVAGARACPPEDCGSFPGYFAILEALRATKKTQEQKELLEWLEDDYNPEWFDLDAVNRRLSGKR
jgi:hypothetical protein